MELLVWRYVVYMLGMFMIRLRAIQVNYVGERQRFSATQLVATYFGKLRDIASNELKTGVQDVVIAVPGWYTDIQRRALLDAASIAGLTTLRLINDTTATALGYGITKSDLPDPENPRHVAFVDVGHSSLSVAIVAFSKGQLTVKSTAYDRNLGGRDIDFALVKHFAEEFKTKYKIDVLSNPKAVFRLAAGCEKLKKILSANHEAPLSVENIMADVDASSHLTREELEGLVADVLDRIPAPLKQALEDSGLTVEELDAIELVGGSTRIPAVRNRIASVFPGKVLSTTLNQDEAVARGATFACAQLSPVFRVREFSVSDITPYPIKVQWTPEPDSQEEDKELLVYPKGNPIPSTKILTFYRKDAFELEAEYAEPSVIPTGINPWIAKFNAKQVPAEPSGDATTVKVKTRLNLHGILSFEAAYVEEVEEKEEPVAMDVDTPEGTTPAPPKKKRVVKKKDIPFITGSSSLDKSVVDSLREQENAMYAADKLVMDTEVRAKTISTMPSAWLTFFFPFRTAKMRLRSTYMTPVASSTIAMLLMSRQKRSRSSSWLSKRLKTGCTQKKARMPPNPPMSLVSTRLRSSGTPSPSATKKPRNALKPSPSSARRSTTTCHRRRLMTRS